MSDRGHVDAVKAALVGMGLHQLLARLGYQGKVLRQARGVIACCLSPYHEDATPSLSIFSVDDGIAFDCHGCGRKGGDVLALVAMRLGFEAVSDFPMVLAEAELVAGVGPAVTRPVIDRPPVVARQPIYPPDALDLWERCTSAYDDPAVAAYLRSRAIDPALVVDRDLARVLPATSLPPWARFKGDMATARTWAELGNRLIMACHDGAGRLVTVRARRITNGETPKDLPPSGYAAGGVVFADPLMRMLLEGRTAPEWWAPQVVIIEEGGPDFLTVATHYGDDESTPAVLGVFSGSWTPAIAARIPDGCRVIVRTHFDEAGERYARLIADSLIGRCDVLRGTST